MNRGEDWVTARGTGASIRVRLGDPVVVAASGVGEKRWGHHQFPRVSVLPGPPEPRLLLTFNGCDDDDLSYGKPGPAYVSDDRGKAWRPFGAGEEDAQGMLTVSHSPISELEYGDALCVPMQDAHRAEELPEDVVRRPLQRYFAYAWRTIHRLDDCPEWVRTYFASVSGTRYSASSRRWEKTDVCWDTRDMLLRVAEGRSWTRTSLEQRVLPVQGELLYADWKTYYLGPDGSVPRNMQTVCMASTDNGRTFERRSIIGADPSGDSILGEACLSQTRDGDILCVMRRTDHRQRPMALARSTDAGRTWTPLQDLHSFGVLPQIRLLRNGILVLSFGRPGVWLSFSPDGAGREWTDPVPVIRGDPAQIYAHSCGYTDLVCLDGRTLLLAYSDFRHEESLGESRKAIVVRTVEVERSPC